MNDCVRDKTGEVITELRENYPSCDFPIDLQQAVVFTCLLDGVRTLRKTHTDLITQESAQASVEADNPEGQR